MDKTYWYYMGIIYTDEGEVEYAQVKETESKYFPMGEVMLETCELAKIEPRQFGVRFVIQVDKFNYDIFYKMIQDSLQ